MFQRAGRFQSQASGVAASRRLFHNRKATENDEEERDAIALSTGIPAAAYVGIVESGKAVWDRDPSRQMQYLLGPGTHRTVSSASSNCKTSRTGTMLQDSTSLRVMPTVNQFYTDCCGNAHWPSPVNVVDETIATPLVQFAVALTKTDQAVTTDELELWAMYMSTGMTQENLIRWCDAMVAAGLKQPGYAEEMSRFL